MAVTPTSLVTNRSVGDANHVSDTNTVHAAVNAVTGDWATKANVVGSVVAVRKVGGVWPASYSTDGTPVYTGGAADGGKRPTTAATVVVMWIGADPSPAIVSTGDAGMRDNLDLRMRTP